MVILFMNIIGVACPTVVSVDEGVLHCPLTDAVTMAATPHHLTADRG